MHFASGTWLLGLPVVLLIWLLVKAADRRVHQRSVVLLGEGHERHREQWHPQLRGWRRWCFLLAVGGLLVALARPQWGASEVTVTQRGRDVVVALDISNSMLAEDVAPNRLERAKTELMSFIRAQSDSRIGLVLFAGAAFVQCPLTADFGTAEIFLEMAAPDMISTQGTALASALTVSRDLLLGGRQGGSEDNFQAILLVTDGEDLEGAWEKEARACVEAGITVIPVGIGEETGGLIPLPGDQGGFLKDDDGQLVLSRLDLASLERLAAIGDGSTFRVGLDGLAGERLRTVLDRLGTRDFEQRRVTAWQERYHWPLGLALLALLLAVALRPSRKAVRVSLLAGMMAGLAPLTAQAQLIRPDEAGAVDRGLSFYREGRYEDALKEFESARAQTPDDPRLALAVGEALARLERWEEAEREFARARDLTGADGLRAESFYNSGTAMLQQGELEPAITRLRESLRLDPDQPDALENLEAAMTLLQQQQQQEQEQQQGEDQQDQDRQDQQQRDQDQQDQDQQDQDQQDQQQRDQDQQDQDRQDQEEEQQQDQQEQQEQAQEDQGEEQQQPTPEELDREQALQLLRALDRDEQELKRSVQQRLRGGNNRSGKRW